MSYATIMAYIDPDRRSEYGVLIAAALADKFNATLIGVSATPIPPPAVANGVIALIPTEDDINLKKAKLTDAGNWFRDIAGKHRKTEWRQCLEFPVDVLSREVRSAELVIIRNPKRLFGEYGYVDPGDTILRMGRPTLLIPDGVSSLQAEHVVIGWKDSREARRAVLDTLPFLHEATRVTIVELCEPDEEQTALERIDDVAR